MQKRQSLIIKTIHIGIGTLLSRMTGFARQVLMIRFLGIGIVSDAFNVAFVMANTLRKIFAEGALNAALTPTVVNVVRHEGKHAASALITLTLVIFQLALLGLCTILSLNAHTVILLTAPGFAGSQASLASSLASILIFYIIFVSATAVYASALQSVNRFFVVASAQVFMNMLYIAQLFIFIYYKFSVYALAWATLANGFIITLIHVYAYKKASFVWARPTQHTYTLFKQVLKKFVPCLISVGSMEISFFIDRMMASFLPVGSISVLSYVWAFVSVPLGLITAFTTVLLPHMSSINKYATARLSFYVLECVKLIAWVTIPISCAMALFSFEIFSTTLLSDNFSLQWVITSSHLLIIFAVGLLFFAINKILFTICYALHDTLRPTIISLISAVINTILNAILMGRYGVIGITTATIIAETIKTILLLYILHRYHAIPLHFSRFVSFCTHLIAQILVIGSLFWGIYTLVYRTIQAHAGTSIYANFFIYKIGLWLWVGPLCGLFALTLYMIRNKYGTRLYFLS